MSKQITARSVLQELKQRGNSKVRKGASRFTRDYGERYRLIGVRMPILRQLAKEYAALTVKEAEKLLRSPFHEARVMGLLVLVRHFQRGNEQEQKCVVQVYLDNTACINCWDLVDLSAHKILGPWMENRSRKVLYRLARSTSVWERRIAIISTFYFIRFSGKKDFSTTLDIAEILLNDEHDLIHKAVGWMLREVGNQDREAEEKFLRKHYRSMPRTMLRYAVEKFPEKRRKAYLAGRIG